MTKPPVQATVTISPYRLVRILNLASLHKELDRIYINVKENQIGTYGFKNGLISYCTFTEPYVDRIELLRDEPVGAVVDVQSWYDTASRLYTSHDKPKTVRDHEFHHSIIEMEKRRERRKIFYEQYMDDYSSCMIDLHCDRSSNPATHRTINAENQYEDPLPTPRLTLVHWDQVHHIMAKYDVDSICVNGKIIKNKYNGKIQAGFTMSNIFSTPTNEEDYGTRIHGKHDLFYSDEISPEEIATALWSEIETSIRRRSPWWVYDSISVPDSQISFDLSKLRRVNKLFDSNDRFRNPTDYSSVPSRFETKVDALEKVVDDYDEVWGPPYPIEVRNEQFVLDPKYPGTSSTDLSSTGVTGPSIRKEVLHLDLIINSLSGLVNIESGPDVPCVAVVKQNKGKTLRYILPISK